MNINVMSTGNHECGKISKSFSFGNSLLNDIDMLNQQDMTAMKQYEYVSKTLLTGKAVIFILITRIKLKMCKLRLWENSLQLKLVSH